jgi:hypothetical protein
MWSYFVDAHPLMALGHPALALSQRERELIPFSLWEKGGDEGRTNYSNQVQFICEST